MDITTLRLLAVLALGMVLGLGCRRSYGASPLAGPLSISIFPAMKAVRQGKHRGGTQSVWQLFSRRVSVALQRRSVVWRSQAEHRGGLHPEALSRSQPSQD